MFDWVFLLAAALIVLGVLIFAVRCGITVQG
jgi:hypothetical protein